jgi:peptidoglycan/xylan/chitin deacetylase (PgdA/CDA1 family)
MRASVARAVRMRARWPKPGGPLAAVLGWHRVDTEGGGLAVAPRTFARQMQTLDLLREQVLVTGVEQAASVLATGNGGTRCVVLTFDDAWADNHANALEQLRRYRFPATLYVPSRLLGTPRYMNRTQVLEMADAGVTIGAHSRTHADLRTCGTAELESEIRGSREDLEDLTGAAVTTFAYPTGLLDDRVVAAVRAAGFGSAVTTRHGWWRPRTDPLLIPRGFAENFSDATFAAAANGGLNVLGPLGAVRDLMPARR